MKKLLTVAILAIAGFIQAQNNIDLTPAVKNVTVYLSGALITTETEAQIPEGRSTVIFHGLPFNIDKESIQLASTGDITILSVTSFEDYFTENKKNTKTKKWQDTLDMLNQDVERITNGMEILQAGKSLLDDNRTAGGTNVGTNVTNVKGLYEYYVHQVTRIEDSLMYLGRKKKVLETKITKLQEEMAQWQTRTTAASDVEALVSTDHAQSIGFKLQYLTYDAGWSAAYDLRAKDIKHSCMLAYKANVYQHTGQDWTGVDLTLSTSNPSVSQTAPTLNPWYLQFQPVYNNQYDRKYSNNAGAYNAAPMAKSRAEDSSTQTNEWAQNAISNTVNENQLAVEFHIDIPYTLPSDNKAHMVEIKKYDLNATYRTEVIPKLNLSAFLMADVTHWDELNLMPGEVNIYYAGTYVGKSYLNTQSTTDTLSFSLGMDKKVIVKRERVKDYNSTKWIGTTKTQAFTYNITVHNTHSDSLSIEVFDQMPLTTDKDIEVIDEDKGTADLNTVTGKLTWKLKLAGGEAKKLTFSYSVKHPKDKPLSNLR